MAQDIIKVKFLGNGDVRIETDPISQPNHANADGLIKAIESAMGGVSTVQKKVKHGHTHVHDHEHAKH